MHLDRFWIRELRSVWSEPLEIRLARDVTAIVGPNRSGKSNVIRGLVAALDPAVTFDPARETPVGRPEAIPEVTLRCEDRLDGTDVVEHITVTWMGGARVVTPEDTVFGPVVHAGPDDTPTEVLARVRAWVDAPDLLVDDLVEALGRVLPDLGAVRIDGDRLLVTDEAGFEVPAASGARTAVAMGLAHHLARRGIELVAVVIEHPEAWLHPAAQETTRDGLVELAVESDAPVVITTESPFLTPRQAGSRVVAIAKDAAGRTRFVGAAEGDRPQAPLLGGLFRDPGFGAVLDRTSRIPAGVAGVVIVEGGTDEAYLRLAAATLDREDELDGLVIEPAGGAMAAALRAVVLRAESQVPMLVLLDNDDPGRRAKDTLTSRFGFDNRRQVTTYAEVVPDHPLGVEAEDLFDWRLVERFVTEQGQHALRGRQRLRRDEWHFDLTTSAKSTFVGWASEQARPAHLERWAALLDLIGERLSG